MGYEGRAHTIADCFKTLPEPTKNICEKRAVYSCDVCHQRYWVVDSADFGMFGKSVAHYDWDKYEGEVVR